MRIERDIYPESTLEGFADKHSLVMRISERAMDKWQREHGLARFTASFKRTEIKDGGVLRSEYGQGDTPAEAMADYARRISHETLVVDAGLPSRHEIRVPRLVEVPQPATV